MSTVKLTELQPLGSELFDDSESYLNELQEQDLKAIHGGGGYSALTSAVYVNSQITASQGISLETATIVTKGPVVYPVVKSEVKV